MGRSKHASNMHIAVGCEISKCLAKQSVHIIYLIDNLHYAYVDEQNSQLVLLKVRLIRNQQIRGNVFSSWRFLFC